MSETALRVIALIERNDRTEVERMLRDMGVAALPVLRELLEHPIRSAKFEWSRWLLPMLVTPFLLFALLGPPDEWILTSLFLILVPGLIVSAAFNCIIDRVTQRYRGLACSLPYTEGQAIAAQVLTEIDDVSAVGLLLETVYWLGSSLPQTVLDAGRDALIRLLPQLTLETASMLTQNQRQALRSLLAIHSFFIRSEMYAGPYDMPMALAILQAYTLVGDPKAMICVERIATANVKTYRRLMGNRVGIRSQQVGEVVDKAVSVLPLLRAQCEAFHTGETLLRASAKPKATPEELLRPAQSNTETPPEQLLRAGLGQSDSPQ